MTDDVKEQIREYAKSHSVHAAAKQFGVTRYAVIKIVDPNEHTKQLEQMRIQALQYYNDNKEQITLEKKETRKQLNPDYKPYRPVPEELKHIPWHQRNKEYTKEQRKQFYQENKEQILQNQKQYIAEHKEERTEYLKQWRLVNKEREQSVNKEYHKANKDKDREWGIQYRAKNKTRIYKYIIEWYQANPEKRWRCSPEYIEWKDSVYKRDGHKCTNPNCKHNVYKIHAHHIKSAKAYIELRYDINNGITLCVECHKEEHKRLREKREVVSPSLSSMLQTTY